jgi:hypothetical protein
LVLRGEILDTSKITSKPTKTPKLYRSVKISSLGNRRRGKHHDLMEGILRELRALEAGSALEIPLTAVGGVELADLRSAVHRAAAAVNIAVQTQSDEKNFYVWVENKIVN